jgi:PEP-CTERM motif
MTHKAIDFTLKTLATLAVGVTVLAGSAHAASWDVSFGSCSSNANPYASAGAWGSISCAASNGVSDPTVAALAWSSSPVTAGSVAGASVYSWDSAGLGVVSAGENPSSEGPHAIDSYGVYDSLVLKFGESVSMDSLTVGWDGHDNANTSPYDDSDVGVFAWIGSKPGDTAAPTTLTGGWTLVSLLTNMGQQTNDTKSFNSTHTVSSSYWLIAAYGTDTAGVADAFKLLTVAGITTPSSNVPEPGSLTLLGLGALGLLTIRRRTHHHTKT